MFENFRQQVAGTLRFRLVGLQAAQKPFFFLRPWGRTGKLTNQPMTQSDAYRMIGRRTISFSLQQCAINSCTGV